MSEVIGIDVGGTKTAGVRVGTAGDVRARSRRPTPYGSPAELIDLLVEIVAELRTDAVVAVGVALPGTVDTSTGTLRFAPRPLIEDLPVRDLLSAAARLPVVIDNDANAAAWAEHRAGSGRGHDDLLLVAPGTGFGCGVVARGRVLGGAHGFAVEGWHLLVEPGNPACLGDLASGTALTRLGREAAARDPRSLLARHAPETVTGEQVTRAATEGDATAIAVLDRIGRVLGMGIAILVKLLDPSIVVVGGGPSQAGELLLEPTRAACRDALAAGHNHTTIEIVAAQFGNEAAAIGAGLLAAEHVS